MSDYNVGKMTDEKRASVREELVEHLAYTHHLADNYSTSNVMVMQFIETAIEGIDAVDRVIALADALAPVDDTSPLGSVGYTIAEQIRKAVRGEV